MNLMVPKRRNFTLVFDIIFSFLSYCVAMCVIIVLLAYFHVCPFHCPFLFVCAFCAVAVTGHLAVDSAR
jgi:hypothetical protein